MRYVNNSKQVLKYKELMLYVRTIRSDDEIQEFQLLLTYIMFNI